MKKGYQYEAANGQITRAEGQGKAKICLELDDGNITDITVDCYYNPHLSCHLFASEKAKITHKIWHCQRNNTLRDTDTDKVMGYVNIAGGVPYLKTKITPNLQLAAVDPLLLHRRLAHCGKPLQKSTTKNAEIEKPKGKVDYDCDACRKAKSKAQVSRTPQIRATKPGEFMHTDVQTVSPIGINGARYVLIIIDDATRAKYVEFAATKAAIADRMITYCKNFKLRHKSYPIRWRMDGGTEQHLGKRRGNRNRVNATKYS
jgi:hypothetical protein